MLIVDPHPLTAQHRATWDRLVYFRTIALAAPLSTDRSQTDTVA